MPTPQYKRCIMFLADGSRPDVLNEELQKGNLPNLARHFVEPGFFSPILSVFPSTTGPAYLPYLTGCYPGTCNVPGIRWFDRQNYAKKGWSFKSFRSYVGLETYLMNRDIAPGIQTLFSSFDRPISILNNIHRDLDPSRNLTRHSRIWHIYYAHLTDHWSYADNIVTNKVLDAVNADADFIFAVFPSIDEYAHRSSVRNPRVVQAYNDVDTNIGKVIDLLKKKGILEETLLLIVSDHGLSDTTRHFDVGPWMEEKGTKTFFYTQIFKRNFKAASMISGNGMAHLYLKHPDGWEHPSSFETISHQGLLLDELRQRPEIDLVISRGDDGYFHFQTGKGHSRAKCTKDEVVYEFGNSDPMDIFTSGQKGSVTLSADLALQATWDSHFPDVFDQARQIFTSPRTGDVLLSAKAGNDLRERYEHPEHKASHGSICPEHMRVPLLMNAKLSSPIYRSIDVFPTVLSLLGKEIPANIDGVNRA